MDSAFLTPQGEVASELPEDAPCGDGWKAGSGIAQHYRSLPDLSENTFNFARDTPPFCKGAALFGCDGYRSDMAPLPSKTVVDCMQAGDASP
jgi:hypothetical protein